MSTLEARRADGAGDSERSGRYGMTDPTTARALAELDDLLRERDALAEQVIQLTQEIEQAAESDAFKDLLRSAIKAGYALGYQAAIDEMKGRQL